MTNEMLENMNFIMEAAKNTEDLTTYSIYLISGYGSMSSTLEINCAPYALFKSVVETLDEFAEKNPIGFFVKITDGIMVIYNAESKQENTRACVDVERGELDLAISFADEQEPSDEFRNRVFTTLTQKAMANSMTLASTFTCNAN